VRRSSPSRAPPTAGSPRRDSGRWRSRAVSVWSTSPAKHGGEARTFAEVSERPRKTFTSPEWSGIESKDRRYSPFCVNTERLVPFRTLTGRQQLYQDHAWMRSTGEGLATYKPPVAPVAGSDFGAIALRYLTPHSKWSIHSTYQDNLHMLTLFRGGPVIWLSDMDAKRINVRDNDWVEVFNDNGVLPARAVISHRIPKGAAIVYHAQDRHVNVPLSEVSGKRGGTHNGHPDPDEAHPHARRLRPALLRLQLLRPDRLPARRGRARPRAPREGALLMVRPENPSLRGRSGASDSLRRVEQLAQGLLGAGGDPTRCRRCGLARAARRDRGQREQQVELLQRWSLDTYLARKRTNPVLGLHRSSFHRSNRVGRSDPRGALEVIVACA
jgi:hypothetical protein